MNSRKTDAIFFSIAGIFVLFFSALLYLDYSHDYSAVRTREIGYIEFKRKTAERKFTAQVLWGKVEDKSPIYNYDSIRTSNDSLAVVHLDNGTKVDLDSNTLVLFSLEDNTLGLEMEEGGIAVNTENSLSEEGNSPGLVIKTAGAVFESSGKGDFALATNKDGEIEADAYSGELQMNDGENTLSVKKGFRLFRNNSGSAETKELSYNTVTPPNSSIYVRKTVPAEINFSWETKGSSGENLKIVLSNYRDFSHETITIPVEGASLTAEIPAGTYFWKIVSDSGSSAPSKFTVLNDTESTPVLPVSEEDFLFHNTSPMVRFKWTKSQYASGYKVQIFRDKGMTDLVEELSSNSTSIASDSFTPGKYYWRVRNLYPARINAEEFVTSGRSFSVTRQETIPVAAIPEESNEKVISVVAIRDNGGILRWNPVRSADSYNIEIAKDSNFNDVVISKEVRNNFYVLPSEMETGDYFWRISVNIDEEASENSDTSRFSIVEKGEIKTIFPLPETYISPSSSSLRFTWADENQGHLYKLEIATNKNFFAPTVSKIIENKREVTIDNVPSGDYFWRITLLNDKNKAEQKSNISSFIVFKIDKNMKLIAPEDKEKLDIVKIDDISFEWTESPLAEVYRFSIYNQLLNSKNIVTELYVTTNRLTVSDLTIFRELDYQWEVTGLRKVEDQWVPVTDNKVSRFTIFLSKRVYVPVELNLGTSGTQTQNIMGGDAIQFVIPDQQ